MNITESVYKKTQTGVIIALLVLCWANFASAQDTNSWQHELTIYGWLTDIGGTVHAPGAPGSGQDFTVDVSDIIDSLEFALMGTWASKKGKWSIIADVLYSDVGDSANGVEVDLATWLINGGIGYDLMQTDQGTLAVIGGVRYLSIEPEVKTSRISRSVSEGFVDGMIGIRGNINFNDKWYLPYYADIGTGDSDLSYQLFAGIGYRFDWGNIRLGYRFLGYEMKDDAPMQDMDLSGPILGVGFQF